MRRMDRSITTQDELQCPHCRRWHPLVQQHRTGTAYTVAMLYFVCRGGYYYSGQVGLTSRFPTRPKLGNTSARANASAPNS